MSTWYLDTSAALKLVINEDESSALVEAINAERPVLAGSWLLETEMRRAAHRSDVLTQRHVTDLLDRMDLYQMTAAMFTQAGLLPGRHLRSLDALHLAAALEIGVDAVVSYDRRMLSAARDMGLAVSSPA